MKRCCLCCPSQSKFISVHFFCSKKAITICHKDKRFYFLLHPVFQWVHNEEESSILLCSGTTSDSALDLHFTELIAKFYKLDTLENYLHQYIFEFVLFEVFMVNILTFFEDFYIVDIGRSYHSTCGTQQWA